MSAGSSYLNFKRLEILLYSFEIVFFPVNSTNNYGKAYNLDSIWKGKIRSHSSLSIQKNLGNIFTYML